MEIGPVVIVPLNVSVMHCPAASVSTFFGFQAFGALPRVIVPVLHVVAVEEDDVFEVVVVVVVVLVVEVVVLGGVGMKAIPSLFTQLSLGGGKFPRLLVVVVVVTQP